MKSKSFKKFKPWVKFLGILLLFNGMVACSDQYTDKEAEKISKRFIENYYVQDDLQQAIALTTQKAKKALEKQLEIIDSDNQVEPTSGKPQIKFKQLDNKALSAESTSIIWEVTSDFANTIYVKTTLVFSKNTKTWEISNFVESNTAF